MILMWDDPNADKGADLRDRLGRAIRNLYPDLTLGVMLDEPYNGIQLDLSFFDVILGYSYGGFPFADWENTANITNRSMFVQSEQGSYDAGETSRLRKSILELLEHAPTGAEIWFCDNAHMKSGKLTTTTTQILLDYLQAELLGVDNYGRFMHDIYDDYNDTIHMGEPNGAPDSWSRYLFLTDTLIPLANSGLFDLLNQSQKIIQLEETIRRLQARLGTLEKIVGEPLPEILIIPLILVPIFRTLYTKRRNRPDRLMDLAHDLTKITIDKGQPPAPIS